MRPTTSTNTSKIFPQPQPSKSLSPLSTLGLLTMGLIIFLAGCSYGPTGIFAGIELERRTQSFSVGLPVVSVQRIAVSDDGTQAAVSGGQLFVRSGTSPTSGANTNWTKVGLPSGFTNSLDVGIADDGIIYAVLIGDSGNKAYTRTGETWAQVVFDPVLSTNDTTYQTPQGVLQAGDTFYFVIQTINKSSNAIVNYQIRNFNGTNTGLDADLASLNAFPKKAVQAGGINTENHYIMTSNGVYRVSDGENVASSISGQTFTGISVILNTVTPTDSLLTVSTAQGNIYISDDTQDFSGSPLINSSPIQVGSTTVKFTDLIYIGGTTLLAGTQGFGYFVVNTSGTATRAIDRSLSNLLDTPLYNSTISTFAYVGNTVGGNLYLGAPGEGVFFGTRGTGNFIQWNPLKE